MRSDGETLRTVATLTTNANPPLSLIQERMPAIIARTDWKVWLGEEDAAPSATGGSTAYLASRPDGQQRQVKNDGPSC
jgi:putative SOS response-associated peptidase YedK